MPHSHGYRMKTRDLFCKDFGKGGTLPTQTFLKVYKVGQIVDIKADGAIHKGMPHKYYHGKTGVIWNVTPRAVGVEVNKQIGNRIIRKRIHVRIEHVKHSRSKEEFVTRVKENEAKKKAAKDGQSKKRLVLKRSPTQPRLGGNICGSKVETLYPAKYIGLYQ